MPFAATRMDPEIIILTEVRQRKTNIIWYHSDVESESHSVLSNSLQPHGLQPTRLLHPWDSPGKNAGVGSHALLQGNLPDPGIKPWSPAMQADSLPSEPPGKPKYGWNLKYDANEPLCKAETDLHREQPCGCQGERQGRTRSLGLAERNFSP